MVKRLIESVLPLKEISEQAVKEKSIRHGHISTLHIWWARRPLVACRAVVFGALVPDPVDPECPASFIKLVFELLTTPAQDELKTDSEGLKARKRLVQFIKDLCTWEASNDRSLIGKARKLILEANDGVPPKVLDPFAGGGAIPLEALRLGCEAHAVELNPVAHLIELCTLVYTQKYGKPFTIERKAVPKYLFEQLERQKEFNFNTDTITIPNRLAYDVERWGKWVLEEARKEIGQFYPSDPDESIPVAYLWARTAKCPNPTCGAEIPLVHQLWLANKGDKKVAFRILPDKKTKQVRFEVVEGPDIDFDPKHGTMRRDSVTCPFCNQPAKGPYLREEGELGRFGEKLMAVVLFSSVAGKTYRVATQADEVIFGKAYKELQKAIKQPINGLPPIPNEPIPYLRSIFNVYVYGFRSWGQLFNSRQALAIVTFIRKVRETHEKICQETGSADYAKALSAYWVRMTLVDTKVELKY